MQQACESPLLVAVAAGSVALPTLLKLATVMAAKNQDLLSCSQLPVVRCFCADAELQLSHPRLTMFMHPVHLLQAFG